MRFTIAWRNQIYKPWSEYYINYESLKSELRLPAGESILNDETWASCLLDELRRIDAFFVQMGQGLLVKLSQLEDDDKSVSEVVEFCNTLDNLGNFLVMNYMAASKLAKTRNKCVIAVALDIRELIQMHNLYNLSRLNDLSTKVELLLLKKFPHLTSPKRSCMLCVEFPECQEQAPHPKRMSLDPTMQNPCMMLLFKRVQ